MCFPDHSVKNPCNSVVTSHSAIDLKRAWPLHCKVIVLSLVRTHQGVSNSALFGGPSICCRPLQTTLCCPSGSLPVLSVVGVGTVHLTRQASASWSLLHSPVAVLLQRWRVTWKSLLNVQCPVYLHCSELSTGSANVRWSQSRMNGQSISLCPKIFNTLHNTSFGNVNCKSKVPDHGAVGSVCNLPA